MSSARRRSRCCCASGSAGSPIRGPTLDRDERAGEAPPGRAARLLRRRRPRRPDRRARARALRRARLRAQGDRAQQARRRDAARARGDLRRGARRLDPRGRDTVFSAHGVSPAVHADAERRSLRTIDATCPLVTKVHREARQVRRRGLHDRPHRPRRPRGGRGHDGRGARAHRARRDRGRRRHAGGRRRRKLAYISQTTLSVDETRTIITRLRERFPHITGPRTDDICYATTNRQAAVKQMAAAVRPRARDRLANSSNSNRLVEVARDHGAASYLIDNDRRFRRSGSRASASSGSPPARARPRSSSQRLVGFFRARGTTDVSEYEVLARGRPLHAPQADPPGDGRSAAA